jgi:hypothetical protein
MSFWKEKSVVRRCVANQEQIQWNCNKQGRTCPETRGGVSIGGQHVFMNKHHTKVSMSWLSRGSVLRIPGKRNPNYE